MQFLFGRTFRAGLFAYPAALCALALGATASFWPRIAAQAPPPSFLWPLVRPLLAAGLELSLLVSLPIAAAFGASPLASESLPRSAGRVVPPLVCVALTLLAVTVAGATALESLERTPGGEVNELLALARKECVSRAPSQVAVPLVGMSWSCERGEPPRVTAKSAKGNGAIAAATVALSDDLRAASFERMQGDVDISNVHLTLHVARAHVRGLPGWGRPRSHSFGARLGLLGTSAFATALLVIMLGARLAWLGRLGRPFVGVCASLALWLMVRQIDRSEYGLVRYLLLPCAGLVAAGLSASVWAVGRRLIALRRAEW